MNNDAMKIAVLGTGIMGTPIARNLLRAGFDVRVWNRTVQKTEPLAAEGAHVAASPAEAAAGADMVLTMLVDGSAVAAVMTGEQGALSVLPADAVWIQMSTVGVPWALCLANLAEGHVGYVDAPVSGSSLPAERGELLVLAAGVPALRDRVRPVFDAVGRHTVWLDRPGDGSRLKLVLNNWLAVLVEGMAETVELSTVLGLDPGLVADTIDSTALKSPYAVDKAHAMVKGDFTPGFPLRHARKDAALALEAADGQDLSVPLTEALLRRWNRAVELGHGDDDVASAITAAAPAHTAGPAVATPPVATPP
ncbi:NAD(P)-dependent oxidoreductase [Streptomyces sp. NPDC048415]|jgi:3-hydroxyisobutyrate dehydrogenase|uniref:NAD(P)-dependent oxidoreductase n=1 Tax=Streptomyces sp. NPDC048415 TaxID=3154822 RepID=UPI003420DBB1